MPRKPIEQSSTYEVATRGSRAKRSTASAAPLPSQRQGDRGDTDGNDSDSDESPPPFRVYLRYRDLQSAGVVNNWPTLLRLIDEQGFPIGIRLGPNMRAWLQTDVEAWLDARPVDRKKMPRTARRPRRNAA